MFEEQYQESTSKEQSTLVRVLLWLIVLIVLGAAGYFVHKAWNIAPVVACTTPYQTSEECLATCNGQCGVALLMNGEPICYECIEEAPPPAEPTCAPGLTDSQTECEQNCPNGACTVESTVGSTSCYLCVLCPDGTFLNEQQCEQSCANGCYVSGRKNDVECFACLP